MATTSTSPAITFVIDALRHVPLIRVLALNHLREKFIGTWAGIVWAFIHPIVLIAIFWVVFAQGFKLPTSGERPFLLVLICGLLPWMAFNEAVMGAAGSVTSKAYLVRKIAFPLEVLPLTNVVSSLIVHVPMLLLGMIIAAWHGRFPGPHLAWLPVYMLALALLATGLGMLLSALSVVFRDVQQGLGIVMNIWFWATPIVWAEDMLPAEYRWLSQWNPITYLIDGYRYALLGPGVPEPTTFAAVLYWSVTGVVMAAGILLFKRLKPNFADLL
ncbi:MAG TPA: ABC transporter permease [Hyphomicrobiaceae bacterium]|nr:ABC transporter permease [Hyphomicrobiaceae bacterium]